MDDVKIASRAEFARMADMLLDLAAAEYLASLELSPKLVVMGADPAAAIQPGYRFGLVPVAELMTIDAGVPGEVVLAALIEKLVRDPEVLVVGHMAEAWRASYTQAERAELGVNLSPEDAPNRVEVLMMTLRSSDCMALKTMPLLRDGRKTTLGPGELLFKPRANKPLLPRYIH